MKHKIIVKCDDGFGLCDWKIISNKGNTVACGYQTHFDELAGQRVFTDSMICLWVASPQIVLKKVELPKKMSASLLHKIIPNMLEDDLIAPLDSLHFSYLKHSDTVYTVAVLSHEVLQNWLDILKTHSIVPEVIAPLAFMLPVVERQWQIGLEGTWAVVKVDEYLAFTVAQSELSTFLDNYFTIAPFRPLVINLMAADEVLLSHDYFAQSPMLKSLILEQHLKAWDFYSEQPLNLCHNHPRFQGMKYNSLVPPIGIGLGLIALLFLTLQLQDILHYQSIVDEQSHEISYIYQKVYPEQTLPTQIKETIEQDFAKKNSTQSGFYHLLFSFGEIFKHSEGLMIKNMHYKAPILRLELEATNYSTIEKLIQDFKDTRLNIHQNKTEQQPNHVKVSLDISEEPLK